MQTVVENFITRQYPQELIAALSMVFRVLATDCPLTSLINYRFMDSLSAVLEGQQNVQSLRSELPEICTLLEVAETCGNLGDITYFLRNIMFQIISTHCSDKQPGIPSDILEVYNPEQQGRAYYFTAHGGRLRDLPAYNISKSKDSHGHCKKVFVETTKSGMTYLFLWFDPLHGHCYGFHVITTSEGRKDPFASALMYMENAPDEIFYDFSCRLEEYCLNREPAFFRNTRFYHDIFHGFSHKCEYVYNSRRVPALDIGINSEVCEQFNSYIQKIKFSARAMNQSHFMFYLQFFIHLWNEKKQATFEAEKKTVEALLQ